MIAIALALVSTEAIKLQRTAALWLAIGAPVLAVLLELIALFDRTYPPSGDAGTVWGILLGGGYTSWLGFCLPILISFEAASLANLEHSGKHWKQLFAFPIPRWSVYTTKMLFCGLLAWVSILIGILGFTGDVLIYSGAHGLNLASAIPWPQMLTMVGKAYMASCFLIVIQTWLSTKFSGVALPVGIGFAALAVGLVLLPLGEGVLSSWYPWTLPLRVLQTNPRDLHNTMLPAVFGWVGALVIGPLACWDLARRQELG